MKAWRVVDEFEAALSEFTGAPHVVTVDSCTNALLLALMYHRDVGRLSPYQVAVSVPRRTYVGVPQVVHLAGFVVDFRDVRWHSSYRLEPLPVVDSAKWFERSMWADHEASPDLVCVSFHVAKRLPLGRGGAVLTELEGAADWLRRARFDGRTAGETGERATRVTVPGLHAYMTPPEAARGLWLLEQFVDRPAADDWTHYPDLEELWPRP